MVHLDEDMFLAVPGARRVLSLARYGGECVSVEALDGLKSGLDHDGRWDGHHPIIG